MEKRQIVAWMLGALAAACVYFVLATALDLWTGVPCNGSRISVLYSALSQTENLGSALRAIIDNPYEDNPYGTVCVDRFGFDAILLALQTLSLVLCGAAGAFIGRNPSAARGATGAFIGVAVYTAFMQMPPDHSVLSLWMWVEVAVVTCVAAAFGYVGGWVVARYLKARK